MFHHMPCLLHQISLELSFHHEQRMKLNDASLIALKSHLMILRNFVFGIFFFLFLSFFPVVARIRLKLQQSYHIICLLGKKLEMIFLFVFPSLLIQKYTFLFKQKFVLIKMALLTALWWLFIDTQRRTELISSPSSFKTCFKHERKILFLHLLIMVSLAIKAIFKSLWYW